ncbi:MAG: hypothetical protein ACKO7P_02955, partial [Bacteroidota bacterium]
MIPKVDVSQRLLASPTGHIFKSADTISIQKARNIQEVNSLPDKFVQENHITETAFPLILLEAWQNFALQYQ